MTVTTITDNSKSTDMRAWSPVSWLNTYNAAVSDIKSNSPMMIGESDSGTGDYYTCRIAVLFNTSTIPVGAIITAAKVRLYLQAAILTGNDFNVKVQNGQPTYPHDPVIDGDYDRTNYAGNGGTSGLATGFTFNAYNDIVLNSTGFSWIDLGGLTKLILRSSNDISATAPLVGTNEFLTFNGPVDANKPKLEITWTYPPRVGAGIVRYGLRHRGN
jgi:hypothetical protein